LNGLHLSNREPVASAPKIRYDANAPCWVSNKNRAWRGSPNPVIVRAKSSLLIQRNQTLRLDRQRRIGGSRLDHALPQFERLSALRRLLADQALAHIEHRPGIVRDLVERTARLGDARLHIALIVDARAVEATTCAKIRAHTSVVRLKF